MLELLLKLIDRCIDLAKRREEINRKLYEDFVQPAFDNVEAVYEDYSKSLRRYRDTIEKTNLWTEEAEQSIVALITKDRLFSEDLLIKLRALSNIETVKLAGLENFVDAIKRFISYLDRGQCRLRQQPRSQPFGLARPHRHARSPRALHQLIYPR